MREKWTNLTIDCYNLGCWCSKCTLIPAHLKENCNVKKSVLKLVKELGRPDGQNTKYLRNSRLA